MEKIKGIASQVRNTISVSGGGNNSSVTTTHIAIFQIEGRQIQCKSSEPILINEGDMVMVASKTGSGILNGYAYMNLNTRAVGNEGWVLMLFFGVLFPAVSVAVFSIFSDPFFGVLPKVIGGIFLVVGLGMFYRGIRVLQAVRVLKKDP